MKNKKIPENVYIIFAIKNVIYPRPFYTFTNKEAAFASYNKYLNHKYFSKPIKFIKDY